MKAILCYSALLTVAAILLAGCKKDSGGNSNPPQETCTLDHAVYYGDAGTIVDTSGLVYTGSQLTTVNLQDYYVTLVYTGNNITRRNYFEYGTSANALGHDILTYNGDNTISSAEFYFTDASLPAPVIYDRIEFSYTGGKLSSALESADTTSTGSQPLVPVFQYDFSFTGNNITTVYLKNLVNNLADTVNYEYDAITNYFAAIPHALYSDQLFTQFDGVLLPFVLSANNVTRLFTSGGSTAISYNVDAKGNITDLLAGGSRIVRYTYKCQ